MSRISNRIIAENQRRMFEALIRQNLAYFAERHSSEFMARLSAGAAAASRCSTCWPARSAAICCR